MPTWKLIWTQDSTSSLMEELLFFHDHALMILLMITTLVGFLMTTLLMNQYTHRHLLEGQLIELIWTMLPGFILIFVALPSLRLLYMLDEINNPLITIKTIGHQWYWSYEYSDFKNIEFDSYMIPPSEMNPWNFRVLDVDYRMIIPFKQQIRLLVSAADVLHSWTIPSISVKIDATPGRLNQVNLMFNRPGIYFGQCSEICGANHSFMPIVVESIPYSQFINWMKKN